MMILDKNAFQQACRYVEAHGRALEIARLRFLFKHAPAAEVIAALAEYQNSDGGFGNALESDIRMPGSSALATSIAFQMLRETGAAVQTEMTRRAAAYLVHTCDLDKLTWRVIPIEAENWPHAPYWSQTGREEGFAGFQLNPTAELLGYLVDYPDGVPAELVTALTGKVVSHLGGLDQMVMHDFLCCQRLVDSIRLPAVNRAAILNELLRLLPGTVSTDPAQWTGYCLRPLWAAPQPSSPFYPQLRAAIAANLDYEIATQLPDGSWPANFSWGDHEPEMWPVVLQEWKGVFVIEKMLALERYGRIEGVG
jgi:hypothetical protein